MKQKQRKQIDSGAGVISEAVTLEAQQAESLNSASVAQLYEDTLAVFVQGKVDQVGALETKLEGLIDRQRAALQQGRVNQPGLLSKPSTRRAWSANQAMMRARLQTLTNRLGVVSEIKHGMGVFAPKVDELATRKLRLEHPSLASDWDAMRVAERRGQLKKRETLEAERSLKTGRSLGQGRDDFSR